MFKISYDKKITMVQGDTGVIRMKISNHELSQGDEVRFAIVNKANPSILLCQHSDKKIVLEKQVTVFEKDGSARIVIYPYDTEYLQPGKYLYEIQVKTKDGRIDTVVPLTALTLMDGSIQGEYGQTTPSKPEPTPSEIELRFKRLENEIIPELGNRITNVENEIDSVNSSLDAIANDAIPSIDKKRYKITRPTKKFFDDACVVNINNTGKQAEVCGFRTPSDVSSYADRDSIILYIDNELPSCVILEVVNFTSNSVQVVGDTSSVEIGMVIDCMNQSELDPFNQTTKFSGIVTEVNGQTIKVSGWYQQGNKAEGQVPNKNRIIINPITKGWCINSNLFLKSDSFAWGGNLAEFGLWNKKSRTTGNKNYRLNGIDMLMYEGYADYLYNASSLYQTTGTTEVDKGYRSAYCNTGYYSVYSNNVGYENKSSNIGFKSSGSNVGFYSEHEPKGFSSVGNDVCFEANTDISKAAFKTTNDGFRVNGQGVIKNLMLNRKTYPTATTLTPNDAFFHIVQQTGAIYTLPNPSNYGLCNIKILATSDVILSGNMMTNTGNISTYNLGAWRTVEFYCDGMDWIRIF